ncbi:MAG: B12-binding domain-containing radical SAM protein [Halioglobus sp.]|nr:B12-binding domain-containing radical SAM protein [Halioglobus sp.]
MPTRRQIHFTQLAGFQRKANPGKMVLVDALNRGYAGELEDLVVAVAAERGAAQPALRALLRSLDAEEFIAHSAPDSHFSGDPVVTPAPLPSVPVRINAPVTLVTAAGRYHWYDHEGRKLLSLCLTEVWAAAQFSESITVDEARIAACDSDSAFPISETDFDALVGQLAGAGLLTDAPLVAEPQDVSVFRTVDTDQVLALVDARVAAHDERVAQRGVDLVQVVPVNTERGTTPAALGLLVAYAMEYAGGQLCDFYDFVPMFLTDESRLVERATTPGIFLFSNYVWNVDKNLELSKAVKAVDSRNLTIHGGPSTPSYEKDCEQFFADHPHVDIAVRGEGELTFAKMLEILNGRLTEGLDRLHDTDGISYRTSSGVQRTGNRERIADLNSIPSPYLMGLFDEFGSVSAGAVIESNRGCPYGCTFCDWGSATLSKVRRFDLDRVYKELEWSATHKIEGASIADANFGMLERDVDITRKIAELKKEHGFPRSVAINYAKNQVRYLREIIEIMADVDILTEGVASLQSTDEDTLKVIARSNIKLDKYDELSTEFRKAKLPLAADIMMGLPGATPQSFMVDLQRCADRDIRVRANPTQLLPNSPMNAPEYREKYGIVARPGEWVQESFSYTREQWEAMDSLRVAFYLLETYGVLRYVARYVRSETGTREVEFYEALRATALRDTRAWPVIAATLRYLEHYMAPPGSWGLFVEEIRRFLLAELGMDNNAALHTVLTVQLAHLPAPDRTFPDVLKLEHDYAAWQDLMLNTREAGHRDDWEAHMPKLAAFGPATLVIEDPEEICSRDVGKHRVVLDMRFRNWELKSPIARARIGSIAAAN